MSRHAYFKTLAVKLADLSGLAWMLKPFYAGRGAILALHRVLPAGARAPEPGNIVRVEQLREALRYIQEGGWEFAPLDEVPERLRSKAGRFVSITMDDGYRDNLLYALPVFREFRAPFTIFPATGFVDRTRLY